MDRQMVRAVFDKLGHDGDGFFAHVADEVDWTVEGTHPLAGRYRSKREFREHTFARLAKVLPDGARLSVNTVLVDGDWAVVELHADTRAANGMRFDNRYCWLCRFADDRIVEVRAYLDSALVAELFRQNPLPDA